MGGVIWTTTLQARRRPWRSHHLRLLCPQEPSHSKCSSRMPSSPRSRRARASLM
ncbi:uncharacterized protein LAESUDRAFT_723800, partial [Laetiporus sulphureus 93-53]